MSRYKRTSLPWGSGIGTHVEDCKTSREVMEKAGLDWTVDKCPLIARMPISANAINNLDGESGDFLRGLNVYKDCPNAFATYRTDIDVPLGLVKSKYEVVQNIDAFSFFDSAIGEGMAQWDRAGYFGYGNKIYITAKLPIETNVKGDVIENYLVFSNSHDGSSSVDILFSPIRVICLNMLNSALDSALSHIRLKHTRSIKERLDRGAEILKIACESAQESQLLFESLTTIKMKDEDVMKYLAKLSLTDEEVYQLELFDKDNGYKKLLYKDYLTLERTGISTRKANIIANMFEYYQDGIGQREIAGSAWGAYNAVTGYYSNAANLEGEKRVDSLLWGNANRIMNKALNSGFVWDKVA